MPYGFPLLNDIVHDPTFQSELDRYPNLRDFLYDPLNPVLQRGNKPYNFETLFDSFTHSPPIPREYPHLSGEEYHVFRTLLLKLLFRTLYHQRSTQSHPAVNCLLRDLDALNRPIILATFNWDCVLESCLAFYFRKNKGDKYRSPHLNTLLFDYRQPSESECFTLLKLHGSINWWVREGKATYVKWGSRDPSLTNIWDHWDGHFENNYPMMLLPQPSKYFSSTFKQLEGQFKYLLEMAQTATEIYFLGYSIPVTDHETNKLFRSLKQTISPDCKLIIQSYGDEFTRYQKIFKDRAEYHYMDFKTLNENDSFLAQLKAGRPPGQIRRI